MTTYNISVHVDGVCRLELNLLRAPIHYHIRYIRPCSGHSSDSTLYRTPEHKCVFPYEGIYEFILSRKTVGVGNLLDPGKVWGLYVLVMKRGDSVLDGLAVDFTTL